MDQTKIDRWEHFTEEEQLAIADGLFGRGMSHMLMDGCDHMLFEAADLLETMIEYGDKISAISSEKRAQYEELKSLMDQFRRARNAPNN